MAKKVLAHTLSEPLSGAMSAKVDINPGDGNLIIDGLNNGEPVLVSGALQYLENQELPTRSVNRSGSQVTLAVKAGGKGQPWLKLPWAACNGATEWQVHLNPTVTFDLTAHTDGGNVKINLAGVAATRIAADTGGGNIDLVLPDSTAGLCVTAKTGAGNVVVYIPSGAAAKIHATSGLGKVIMSAGFTQVAKNTYQSPDYESAIERAEIVLSSGAGNVVIKERAVQREAAAA